VPGRPGPPGQVAASGVARVSQPERHAVDLAVRLVDAIGEEAVNVAAAVLVGGQGAHGDGRRGESGGRNRRFVLEVGDCWCLLFAMRYFG
jgi:hypothetical protein